jgi:hypothetical protein
MIKLAVGLPAYRSQLHASHAYMWTSFGRATVDHPAVELVSFQAVDVCGVGKARNTLLREAMSDKADWLLMCDSDNYLLPSQDGPDVGDVMLRMIVTGEEASAAVIAAPSYARTQERPNYFADLDGKIGADREVFEAERVGGGMMAVNVRWMVKHWPDPPWFVPRYMPGPDLPVLGEDWTFCEGVHNREGLILCDGRAWLGHG